jgi:hypothetical protein
MKDLNALRKENDDEEVFNYGIGFWACSAGFIGRITG